MIRPLLKMIHGDAFAYLRELTFILVFNFF